MWSACQAPLPDVPGLTRGMSVQKIALRQAAWCNESLCGGNLTAPLDAPPPAPAVRGSPSPHWTPAPSPACSGNSTTAWLTGATKYNRREVHVICSSMGVKRLLNVMGLCRSCSSIQRTAGHLHCRAQRPGPPCSGTAACSALCQSSLSGPPPVQHAGSPVAVLTLRPQRLQLVKCTAQARKPANDAIAWQPCCTAAAAGAPGRPAPR